MIAWLKNPDIAAKFIKEIANPEALLIFFEAASEAVPLETFYRECLYPRLGLHVLGSVDISSTAPKMHPE